jgi:pyrimidine-specific ribonucleoside hydrolase
MNENNISHPIIIDTDMAPDDWAAILYLAKREDVRIKGITITGTGEVHGKQGAINCLRLLELLNKSHIPVAYGSSKPLKFSHKFPWIMRFAVDRRLFIKFPKTKKKPLDIKALDLMNKIVNSSSKKIYLIALGPLTNLAKVLQKYSETKENIEKIYIMGGAVDVKGNISEVSRSIDNPYAEWNIYCDPHAANIVFQSGIPIVLVPLDVTNQVPIDKKFINRLKDNQNNVICQFLLKIIKRFGSRIEKSSIPFWDLVAASILGNEVIVKKETRKIRVIAQEGRQSGRIIEDPEDGTLIEICKKIDREEYLRNVFNTILSR